MKRALRALASSVLRLLPLLFAPGPAAAGDISIAVLDFELNDVTTKVSPDPVDRAEAERTATLKPALTEALRNKGGYRIVDIGKDAQDLADAGFGYLWDHADVAAELGRKYGADWIVVGRNHKASYLFVYFQAHVIDTRTARRAGDLYVEVKGQQQKITPKGIARLAEQIDTTIRTRQTASDTHHAP
jgi:hypothetical protein